MKWFHSEESEGSLDFLMMVRLFLFVYRDIQEWVLDLFL